VVTVNSGFKKIGFLSYKLLTSYGRRHIGYDMIQAHRTNLHYVESWSLIGYGPVKHDFWVFSSGVKISRLMSLSLIIPEQRSGVFVLLQPLGLEAGFFHHPHHELTFELVGFANSLEGVQFIDNTESGNDLTGHYTFTHHNNVGTVRFSPAGVAILNVGGTITFIDYFRG